MDQGNPAGSLESQLAYKTVRNGGRLIVADRWYPSSKTCLGCGAVKTKLALRERTFSPQPKRHKMNTKTLRSP